jgi:hypothetical protein
MPRITHEQAKSYEGFMIFEGRWRLKSYFFSKFLQEFINRQDQPGDQFAEIRQAWIEYGFEPFTPKMHLTVYLPCDRTSPPAFVVESCEQYDERVLVNDDQNVIQRTKAARGNESEQNRKLRTSSGHFHPGMKGESIVDCREHNHHSPYKDHPMLFCDVFRVHLNRHGCLYSADPQVLFQDKQSLATSMLFRDCDGTWSSAFTRSLSTVRRSCGRHQIREEVSPSCESENDGLMVFEGDLEALFSTTNSS